MLILVGLGLWCFTPLSTIFQLYRVLLVEETVVPRENHWPEASHWQTYWSWYNFECNVSI